MHKWAMFILFIAASVLGLSVIIFAPPTHGEEALPEAEENEVQFILTNFQFDQPEYRVKAGETVKLTLINKQGTHGVYIEGADINLDKSNPSVEFTFDAPGEYNMFCSVMCGLGHSDMVAKLIVEEPAADGAGEGAEEAA
jgi:cytochrome c oxidase subunit 2